MFSTHPHTPIHALMLIATLTKAHKTHFTLLASVYFTYHFEPWILFCSFCTEWILPNPSSSFLFIDSVLVRL